MKRIDTTTAVTDMFGPGKSGWRNGNKAQGIPATEFNADWPNNVQEEICNVIEAAGITLDGSNRAQLLQAIRGIIAGGLATEEVAGIARIATAEEAEAGTDDGTIITPAKLANALKTRGIPLGGQIGQILTKTADGAGWANPPIAMPIGAIYVQLPDQVGPSDLFEGIWENISAKYAGLFFRAEGGNAAAFGTNQAGGAPNIYGNLYNGIGSSASADGSITATANTGLDTSTGGGQWRFKSFSLSANRIHSAYSLTEFRPYNTAIRIWKRTA